MKRTILIVALLATAACSAEPVETVVAENGPVGASFIAVDEPDLNAQIKSPVPESEQKLCSGHDEMVAYMGANGYSFDGYEGGGTGTASIVERFKGQKEDDLRYVLHGPESDCLAPVEAE